MAGKATGYGQTTARKVYGVWFSQALSSLVKTKAFDNLETFPAIDDLTSVTNDILAGTTGNGSKSMVGYIDTTNAAPGAAGWMPASATGGSANPNRLKGETSYVTQEGAILGADEYITYNMTIEVPYDVTTSMNLGFDLVFEYTYTGTAPTVTHKYNTGSEGTPSWTTMVPGTDGVLHCRAGSGAVGGGGDGHYYVTIPLTGVALTAEGWVDTDTTP